MNKPFFISVITPCLNSKSTIERCIKSVLIQKKRNFEHIIIDGASKDGTLNVLKKYPHLNVVSEPDESQEHAMNKGFLISKGNIIVYLNSDDYFFPGAFKAVLKEFEKGAKFVVGNVFIKSKRLNSEFLNIPKTSHLEMLHHWRPNSFCHNPCGYFYHREVQNKFPINKKNYAIQDLEFLLSASSEYLFTKIDQTLGCYEDNKNTKTDRTQRKLNYWSSNTFKFLNRHINKLSQKDKEEFKKNQRIGYVQMQGQMNKINYGNSIKLEIKRPKQLSVSFIVPTFNCGQYIERCINSIFSQKLHDFEVIIVDDASTDNTASILKKYKSQENIHVITHKKNKRLGAARNSGLNAVSKKCTMFLDSDDWLEENKVGNLLEVFDEYNCDILEAGIQKKFENGTSQAYHSYAFSCSGGIEALNYYADYFIASVVWNKIYRTNLIKKNKLKFWEPFWHEDILFTANAIYNSKNYLAVSEVLVNYFQRKQSIVSMDPTKDHLVSYIIIMERLENFLRKNKKIADDYFLGFKLMKSHGIDPVICDILRFALKNLNTWQSDIINACTIVLKDRSQFVSNLLIKIINQEITKELNLQKNLADQKHLKSTQDSKSNLFLWYCHLRDYRLDRKILRPIEKAVKRLIRRE